jgi:hypothetical protein
MEEIRKVLAYRVQMIGEKGGDVLAGIFISLS